MTKITTQFNGRDWAVLADGQKIGNVINLTPAARGCQPYSATVVWGRPGAGSLGSFPTPEAAVAAIAEAHARRVRPKAPPAANPAPASAPSKPRLQILPAKEFPSTHSTVNFNGALIGTIAKLPAFDGRPFNGMHLIRYVANVPEFGLTGYFASPEEAARKIHERWATNRARERM